jgi:NTE family protein
MKKTIFTIIALLIFTLSINAQKQKVGITLSGGGALGFGHIGVLQALEDHGIQPTIVAGTSMGALVGSMYANGLHPQEIFDLVKEHNFDNISKILTLGVKRGSMGFSDHKNVLSILKKGLPYNDFDSLKMPLYVSVTNLSEGTLEIIHSGNRMYEYLMASSSIPLVFDAIELDSMYYVDGGILNNLPAQAIRDKCTYLIGVDVNPEKYRSKLKSPKDAAMRSLSILIYENTRPGIALCDFVIEVPSNFFYNPMDFNNFYEIYQIGYKAGRDYIKAHPELLKKCRTK